MSPCRVCDAKCCKYFALQIDAPKNKDDFENIRWFLAHKGVKVFIESRRWHLDISNQCRYLTKDHKCRIYEKRPLVCREHSARTCEARSGDFDHTIEFKNMEDLDKYLEEKKAKRRKKRAKK